MGIIESIVLLVVLLGVVALNLSMFIWPVVTAVILVGFSVFSSISAIVLSLFWALYIISIIVLCMAQCRRQWLFAPLLKKIKASFPNMSQTERDAIEAGDVWWEGELFSGKPNWNHLLKNPQPKLSEEEQQFIDEKVTTLCAMLNEWEISQQQDLPEEVWAYIKAEKFWAMGIPKSHGGLEFSALAHSTVIMSIATCSTVAAITVMVPNSLGPAELLIHYGTDQQKQHYLPKLAVGEEIPCFALTSLDAGSDASSMTDYGEVCYGYFNGEKVLGMKLTWNKRYITLAPVATVLGLAFKLYDPEHLLGEEDEVGITVCLIPTDHPGVEVGHRHNPMRVPFMNGPTRGKDVFVPLDWVIGGRDQVGQGWRMLMECLSAGRGVSLPATATAAGKLLYKTTGAYARIRRQFKIPVSQFEGVQTALADLAGKTFMQEAVRVFVAGAIDDGQRPAIASAIAKYHLTEMSRDIVNHAMDVHGGKAIQTGPSNYVFPAYIANPIGITVEGANILTRSLIVFGQGVMRCHPYLLKEMEIIQNNSADQLVQFDRQVMKHLSYTLSNFAKCFLSGITGGKLVWVRGPKPIRKYLKQLNRMSSILALLTDVSLFVYGGRLKRKEAISARLGDILSYLFIASATIKWYSGKGYEKHCASYVHWSIRYCLWQMQEAIVGLLDNFPIKSLAIVLGWVIFPFGRPYIAPSDRLNHSIVKPMTEDSKIREMLTEGCGYREDGAVGLLEKLFLMSTDVGGLLKQVQRAKSEGKLIEYGSYPLLIKDALNKDLINQDEADLLLEYHELSVKVLSVDEFDMNLSKI